MPLIPTRRDQAPLLCRTAVAETPGPVEGASRNALYPPPGECPSPAPRPGQTPHLSCKTTARGVVLVLVVVAWPWLRMSPQVPCSRGGRAAKAMSQEEQRSRNELHGEVADETAPRVA